MAKPKRTFSADVGQFSTGTAGPDQLEYDLDNLCSALDPSTLFKDGSAGGIGSENLRSDYQVDQTQSPSSNIGRLDTLLGRIANRIKAILGGTNPDWKNDPVTTLTAVKAHMDDATKHSGLASVDGVSNPNGNVDLIAGTGIAIAADNVAKTIQITATGTAAPAAHATAHASNGTDPVTPASIGAETPAGTQSKVDTHAAIASAHHTRYTDAEAVAAIKAADGAGSELDSDTVDGYHASYFAPSSHVGAAGAAHAVATPSVAGFMSATDKSKLDGISASAKQVAVWTGTVSDGGTIPVPSGWTRDQCAVFVSIRDGRAKDTTVNWDDTAVQCWVDPSTWVVRADVFDSDGRAYTAVANYLIIGVR